MSEDNGSLAIESALKRPRFDRDSTQALGPQYINVTEFWQEMINSASEYNPKYTIAEGERFQNSLATIVPATTASQGLPIMIPADRQNLNEELNAEWGATSNFVFGITAAGVHVHPKMPQRCINTLSP